MSLDPQPKFVLFAGFLCCNICRRSPDEEPWRWCDHLAKLIHQNEDANFLTPGLTINVPIMAGEDIWAEVHISSDTLPGGIARMEMYYKPEFANLKKVDLGFWNPGEGMGVVRSCIIDHVRSRLDPNEQVTKAVPIVTDCPSHSTHNLPAKRWMAACHNDIGKKWKCLWNIVLEGACTYCVQLGSDPTNNGLGANATTAGTPSGSFLGDGPWNPSPLPF